MSTLNWVQDVNGNYEVSSPEHLIQIMNNGTKYTNTGDIPPSYFFSNAPFLQTVDIDLANYHDDIAVIGGLGSYQGSYDGGGHSIANWELKNGSDQITYSGMFSRIAGNGSVKHLRLTGVWKNIGNALFKGFITGAINGANTVIDDITTDFDTGTIVSGDVTLYLGFIAGLLEYGHISGCTIGGSITFSGRGDNVGGICGGIDRGASITYCANYGNYGSGLGYGNTNTVATVGGIAGRCFYGFTNMHNLINGMTGDLYGYTVGGIIGNYRFASSVPVRADTWLNCMVGSILSYRTNATMGGVFGDIQENSGKIANLSNVVNIMSGSIQDGTYTGGLVGRAHNSGSSTFTLSNSLVAMNGNVEHNVVGIITKPTQSTVTVNVDTSFGMTFTTDTYSTTDPLVGYLTDSVFTLCPYLDMSGTNVFGTVLEFDTTFSNLGGLDVSSPFAQYTTLTIHTSPTISFPVSTEFDFADTNTTKYYTYSKRGSINTDLYVDDTLTVLSTKADTLFNQSGTLISGLPWTQDGSGYYEISSFKHLIQLMTKGTVYTDTGSFPSDYRTGTYIQTVDCDLLSVAGGIAPIGTSAEPFVGDYDGGGFSILNWSYGEGTTGGGVGVRIGLFGEVQGNISNLKLRGKWDFSISDCEQASFLIGKLASGSIYNIDAEFDNGTTIIPETGTTGKNTCGILIGESAGNVTGITLSGNVRVLGRSSIIGGVIGETLSGSSVSWIYNRCVFNSAFNLYNIMVGDIYGEFVGGIVGKLNTEAMTRSDTWVNCMQGDMKGVLTKMVNYMFGDISSTLSGGIIGRTIDGSGGTAPDVQCNNSVIAMNGFVKDTSIGQTGDSVDMTLIFHI